MCGIVGFAGHGDKEDVLRMVQTIRYRGPDDVGTYAEHGIGLGHARLSIIDLSPSGHQPMWNAKHTVGIVFNGEIYNFPLIKKELIAKGYTFRGTSDTEVIIALYEEYGEKCFERLNGMFAIALYDTPKKKMFLVRDRMGKKPLYYGMFDGTLVFASEPKALFAHPNVTKKIDIIALNAYLALDYVPTPLSIYEGVSKLEPATILTFENGGIKQEPFWSPVMEKSELSIKSATKQLDQFLYRAVKSRLVADVPLGVFLSGGLDSSTVAYYAAKAKKEPIHTFSIGFDESSFDESIYAAQVAKHLNTIHHHKKLTGEDSLSVIPEIFAKLDEPLADASVIPTYLLSRFTKEYVTVAIGGDGGDELFAGYPTFQAEKIYKASSIIPLSVRVSSFRFLKRFLPLSNTYLSTEFKINKFLDGIDESGIARRHLKWLGTWSADERSRIVNNKTWNLLRLSDPYVSGLRYFDELHAADERNKLLFMYQRTYMMDQVMVKVDRASMYCGLETRAPFLDTSVVEFANSLPYPYKLSGLTSKYILKKLMKDKLPEGIAYRKKQGFGIPVAEWLRGPLKNWGEELLAMEEVKRNSLFNSEYLRRIWSEHQEGTHDHRKKLWNILVFLEWQKNFYT